MEDVASTAKPASRLRQFSMKSLPSQLLVVPSTGSINGMVQPLTKDVALAQVLSLVPKLHANDEQPTPPSWLAIAAAYCGWYGLIAVTWAPPLAWVSCAAALAIKPNALPKSLAIGWSISTAAVGCWVARELRLLSILSHSSTSHKAVTAAKKKRVAVIGAGPAGIVSVKELLEVGMDVVCFEASDGIGGVFRYDPERPGCVWEGVTLTSSPWITAFSDFQPDSSSHRHWHHSEYLKYLSDYAQNFGLMKCIQFNTFVKSVDPLYSSVRQSGWHVTICGPDGKETTESFDNVVICAGLNQTPKPITTPGIERFQGTVVHSSEYKVPEKFRGKNVMIVGLGESAVDIAHELAGVANSVHLSVRHGRFLISRVNPLNGVANDYDTNRLRYSTPLSVANWFMLTKRYICATLGHMDARTRLRHEILSKATHGPLSQAATKSDDFLQDVLDSSIKLCGPLDKLGATNAECQGQSIKLDAIIYAHGFVPNWPFLPQEQDGNTSDTQFPEKICSASVARLYLRMFTPRFGDKLSFVGYARPAIGAIPPTAEVQARYVAQVISGNRQLPDEMEMSKLIVEQYKEREMQFPGLCPKSPVVQWIPYCDQVAHLAGIRPNPWTLMRDPVLLWQSLTGPFTVAFYRLSGPGANMEVARDTITRLPRMHQISELATMALLHFYSSFFGFESNILWL